MSQMELLLRILLAGMLGGLVGIERESLNRPAGFRTHILVCMGSALVMVVSIYAFVGMQEADPGRIAAQVVTGIGFLGAGTIMREGATIRGLTTAASIWVMGAIGLAIGSGMYWEGVFTAAITFVVLRYSRYLERVLIRKHQYQIISLTLADRPGRLGQITTAIGNLGIDIQNIELCPTEEEGIILIELYIQLPFNKSLKDIDQALYEIDGVHRVEHS